MRASKPITVTLGKQQAVLEERLASGEYESASEVVRAGLRALERERAAFDEVLRRKVQEALDDPRQSVGIDEAFEEVRAFTREMRARAGKSWSQVQKGSGRRSEGDLRVSC